MNATTTISAPTTVFAPTTVTSSGSSLGSYLLLEQGGFLLTENGNTIS